MSDKEFVLSKWPDANAMLRALMQKFGLLPQDVDEKLLTTPTCSGTPTDAVALIAG